MNQDLNLLFTQISRGDAQAFREVFDLWYGPLYSYALSYTKLNELASDVMQQVFLKVWERREILDKVEDPVSWLYTAARFQAFRVLKRELKHDVYVQNAAKSMQTQVITPEENLIRTNAETTVRRILQQLTEKQRQAYILSRFEGWSYRQIADLWQISVPTVKEHVTKAAKVIHEQLAARRNDLIIWLIFPTLFFL